MLNTEFTQIVPKNAPPINVAGGVFVFRSVRIPAGVTVRAVGANPLVWIVRDNFVVDGELVVNGGNGTSVHTLGTANFPKSGGVGGPAAGRGGNGSPNAVATSLFGEAGLGPPSLFGVGGGGGGSLSCLLACNRGSAGGGGSFATQGDPYYPVKAAGPSFVEQLGQGGFGCMGNSGSTTRNLMGGAPGRRYFNNADPGDDFYGEGYDLNTRRLVRGELPFVVGGSGGGGGGNRAPFCGFNPGYALDSSGAGGGGGGGALVVIALGSIVVGQNGVISANGGNGGGGEQAGSNTQGGGAGGGSGGLVILRASQSIVFFAHGETYARGDYSFAISADGGIGTQGSFGGIPIAAKYPPPTSGAAWDHAPAGGFGGLGIVQLMAPPGDNSVDGTNTLLDDNIHVIKNNQLLAGLEKQRYLAWRGFPNASGVWVDDRGNPTGIGDNEGDIRPTPILLPIFP